MLDDYLGHTDREEGWIQGFQSLMEYKICYRKLKPLFHHCIRCFITHVYPVFYGVFCMTVSFNYTLKYCIMSLPRAFPAVIVGIKDIVIVNTNDLITFKLHNKFSDDIPA